MMNDSLLALYMGYAFSHAVNVQHVLVPGELTVPYVVYWKDEEPTPVPYPAASQQDAGEKARAARAQFSGSGWSSGREGRLNQSHENERDVLLIEGWVPTIATPLELLVYYRTKPFRLVQGFFWKSHCQARQNARAFMAEFRRGILLQPFGQECMGYIEHAELFH